MGVWDDLPYSQKPFWEKEKELSKMSSFDAERTARRDKSLPFFSKERFIPDFEFPWDDD